MKLISKFRDYYDNIQSYGYDSNIIYIRNPNIITIPNIIKDKNIISETSTGTYFGKTIYNINPPYIKMETIPTIFCGKLYIGFKINYGIKKIWENGIYITKNHKTIEYNYDKILEIINLNDKFKKWFNEKVYLCTTKLNNKIKEMLSLNGTSYGMDLCIKYNTPIISLLDIDNVKNYYSNANLYDLSFYKIMDPYTAYQEIEMFISSILVKPDKEPWPISDKLKAETHGFNNYSFRKRPEKRNN